jgi:hypothetical protein
MTDGTENATDDFGKEEHWDSSLDEIGDAGYQDIITPYVGYEAKMKEGNPVRIRLARPSTETSKAVLVGVYADCVVIQTADDYVVVPRETVIVSIPRDEWESGEWGDEENLA